MPETAYEVHITTRNFPEDQSFGFEAIEIIPPISRALAEVVCNKVVEHCDAYEIADEESSDLLPTEVTAFGFCDEGATVNTLLKFRTTPGFDAQSVNDAGPRLKLRTTVEEILSPSGQAIKDSLAKKL
jgi:hypothetical protein